MLDSDRVEDGEDVCEVMVDVVDVDFIISKSKAYVLPPLLKHEDICG